MCRDTRFLFNRRSGEQPLAMRSTVVWRLRRLAEAESELHLRFRIE